MEKIFFISCSILIFASCGGVNVGNTPVIDIITASSPADGATGVDVTQSITVFFGAEVDPTTINSSNIYLTRAGGTVWIPGNITYDNAAMSITFTPLFPLVAGATHTFTITNAVLTKGVGSNAYNLIFTTKKSPILFVTNLDPANPAVTTGYNIWSYDPDTAARTNLTSYSSGTAFNPVWSPDYKRISYIYGLSRGPNEQPADSQTVDVFVMDADGSGRTNLTGLSGNAKALNPTWHPDGSKVYFQLRPDGANFFNINFVDQGGGSLTSLTNRPPGETTANSDIGYYFTFSPAGTEVLYPVKNETTGTIDLHLTGADGSGDSAITNVGTGHQAAMGFFSTDGTNVYFSATPFSNIYSVLTDGSGLVNISGGAADQWYKMLALFPDGAKILFMFGHDPSAPFEPIYDLYVMNVDGSSRTALTSASATEMATKAFLSPDGSLVAYGFGEPDSLINLFLTGSDGSANKQITSLAIMQSLINVLWSPDGDKLAYSDGDMLSIGFGSGKIVLINNDGSSAVDIAGSATSDAWLGDWW